MKKNSLRGISARFLGLFLIATVSQAAASESELPRRGLLGIQVTTQEGAPVAVLDLMPEGPGMASGLAKGDVINKIGDVPVSNAQGFAAAAARLREGVPVALAITRSGAPMTLTLRPGARPLEALSGASIDYGAAHLPSGNRARTLTSIPVTSPLARSGKFPAVILIQGIPCSSVETLQNPQHPYSQIIAGLNNAGFATLRVEKPGVGDSEGKSCLDGGFEREMEALKAATEILKKRPDIDGTRLYAIGVSMGGIQAPLLARAHRLAGIVTFGTGVQPWFDYTVNNFRERWLAQGQDPAQIDATMRLWRKYFAMMLIFGQTPRQIAAAEPELIETLKPILGGDIERFAGRHFTFHQELDGQDLATAWAAYKGDVLAVHGEYDWVASRNDHKLIPEIVQRHGGGSARFEILKGMDHGFTTHGSLEESFQNAFQGSPSTAFYELAVTWLTSEAQKAR